MALTAEAKKNPKAIPEQVAPDHLYNRAAAVQFLGSQSAYRAAIRNGLRYIKRGKRTFVRGADLIAFVVGEAAK